MAAGERRGPAAVDWDIKGDLSAPTKTLTAAPTEALTAAVAGRTVMVAITEPAAKASNRSCATGMPTLLAKAANKRGPACVYIQIIFFKKKKKKKRKHFKAVRFSNVTNKISQDFGLKKKKTKSKKKYSSYHNQNRPWLWQSRLPSAAARIEQQAAAARRCFEAMAAME
jgi:hypothetical protein